MPSPTIICVPGITFAGLKPAILDDLKEFQAYLKRTVVVTSALRQGDSAEHGNGLAVDIIVPGMDLMELYLAAERFNFVGIGVYPHWSYNGVRTGGLHLDHRVKYPGARWMGIKDAKGVNTYLALSKDNLQNYGVI